MVELIVATFIFSLVMSVSMGALITGLDANRKNQSLKSILNNLNVVLDTMSKNLAVGAYYGCDVIVILPHNSSDVADCPISSGGGTSISFLANEDLDNRGGANDVITYSFESADAAIYRTIDYGDGGGAGPVRMTAKEINITDLNFYVTGSTPVTGGDYNQPKVLIVVNGSAAAGSRSGPTVFKVQTQVTQRIPDFE